MKQFFTLSIYLIFLLPFTISAQEIISTSFEDYSTGNVGSQNKWVVTKGVASVTESSDYAYTGSKGLQFQATAGLQVDHEAFSKSVEGLGGDVYLDFRIKINSISTSSFAITGYDLTSSSRSFMIEFSGDGKNKIKIYNGSAGSATIIPVYNLNEWNRITLKISNGAATYQFALNGAVYEENLGFREIKSGATTFDYHSIRFTQTSGTIVAALDDVYIGSNPVSGINFGETGERENFAVTVNQPANALISLLPQPVDGKYASGTKVTASVAVTDLCNYRFSNWTNDISGSAMPLTFTVTKDMAIGANIVQNTVSGVMRSVKNYAELKTAIESMNPGDVIELENGEYSGSGLSVTRSGCEDHPIIIRAKNKGQAILKGVLNFSLKQVGYITFEGLIFDLQPVSSIFKLEGANNVRITKNEFRMAKVEEAQSSKWILIGDVWDKVVCTSHHNRIDHNLFDTKLDGGAWVVIDGAHGTNPGDISKYDRIDHNHFKKNTPRADNEKETIRIGVSDLTPSSAYCTVEYNLFEDCDGDPEIVSVKSWNNVIRYNTFRRCLGTVCLRQGGNNTVDGNYFFGEGKFVDGSGCGGVRVYGEKHKIINNYFEGLTGSRWDAACTITNGDTPVTSTSWSSHFIPKDVVFAFNTYVNNKSNIEIGFLNSGNYGKSPEGCVIANNIYLENGAPIVTVYNAPSLSGVSFSNNIMYPTGTSSVGISYTSSEISVVDPLLIKTDCKAYNTDCSECLPYSLYKLSPNSPALSAAKGSFDYVTLDFEGQTRGEMKDIGADQHSVGNIVSGIIGEEHVGPYAVDFELSILTQIDEEQNEESSLAIHWNSSDNIVVRFNAPGYSNALINIYNSTGLKCKVVSLKTDLGLNEANIHLSDFPVGTYIVEVITNDYRLNKKFLKSN